MHVVPTEQLLQVLPTSLTQLRLSYESNESGEDLELVECSDDPMDADDSDSASDEDAGQQYAHIKPKPWHNWVTPLVAGLAPLTGLRSLTLDVDMSQSYNHADVKKADNSAILRAVKPLTQLTELTLPNSSFEDLQATTESLSQLPISLQSFAVYETRTQRCYFGRSCSSLGHLSALTRLDLGGTYFGNSLIDEPAAVPVLPTSLRHISCTSEYVGSTWCPMSVLKTLTQLEHLESSYPAAALANVAASLSCLTHVEMEYCLHRPEANAGRAWDENSEEGEQGEHDEQQEQDAQAAQAEESLEEPTFGLSAAVARLAAGGMIDAVRRVTLSGQYVYGPEHSIVAGPEVLQQLAQLPNLCSLGFSSYVRVSDEGLSAFSCLAGLTALDMQSYECSKQQMLQGLPDVVEQLPLLRKLVVPSRREMYRAWGPAEQQALKELLSGITHLTCVGL